MATTVRRSLAPTLAAITGFGIAFGLVQVDRFVRERMRATRSPRLKHPEAESPAEEPLAVQAARATEPHRGREATSPTALPLRGWKDVLWRTVQEVSDDRLLLIAAGVVFYALLATVPAITALVSLYGMFASADSIERHLAFIVTFVPSGAYELVRDQVIRIAGKSDGKLTLAFVTGLAIALWSANAGMKAIFDALNAVYDEREKRSFIMLNLMSLAFTLSGIVVLLLMIGAVVVLPLALTSLGIAADRQTQLLALLRWPALLVVVITGLALLYRFGPSRRRAQWRWLSVGSVLAAAAWLAVSALLSWYMSRFADYNATYGSLGAVIGLMTWMWVSVAVILIGAELNSELEHQTARDTTVGREKPLGRRGAVMADTVGAAQD